MSLFKKKLPIDQRRQEREALALPLVQARASVESAKEAATRAALELADDAKL
jgi:hypothetical protein